MGVEVTIPIHSPLLTKIEARGGAAKSGGATAASQEEDVEDVVIKHFIHNEIELRF